MPNEDGASDWIMETFFERKYDAAGCIALSNYHKLVIHGEELVEAGEISAEPKFKAYRDKLGAGIRSELLAKFIKMHADLPAHRFLESEE
ncbi:MAG: hypothetical protein WC069_04100 [Candidatus Shapirobacteria bacterium]